MQPEQLEYRSPTAARPARGSPRFWAVTFVVSGLIALACIPTVFVFEHFHWWEAPVHGTSFCASVVCASSAVTYLLLVRRSADRATLFGLPTRTLAYLALGLAGGFLLLLAAVVVLISFSMKDF
jgi:hypothetical protein